MSTTTQYYKTRRGIGTERTWQPIDWLLVDVGGEGEIVGYEIIGDHTQFDALWVIASMALAPDVQRELDELRRERSARP